MARSSMLRSSHRLFVLLAHGVCLTVLSGLGLLMTAAVASADSLTELYACDGTFDSNLNTCLSSYFSCMSSAVTTQEIQQCVSDFDNCGSGGVHDYSECLGGIGIISPCQKAREAVNLCNSAYGNCDATAAEEAAAEGFAYACLDAYSDCYNASGIWQCE